MLIFPMDLFYGHPMDFERKLKRPVVIRGRNSPSSDPRRCGLKLMKEGCNSQMSWTCEGNFESFRPPLGGIYHFVDGWFDFRLSLVP